MGDGAGHRRSGLLDYLDRRRLWSLLFFTSGARIHEVVRLHLLPLDSGAVIKLTLCMNPLVAVLTLNPFSTIISLLRGILVVDLIAIVTELVALECVCTPQAELMSSSALR